jgi:hypothetical protein
MFCAFVAYFALPRDLNSASFLTPEEREFAIRRLQDVSLSGTVSKLKLACPFSPELILTANILSTEHDYEEKFQWSEVRRGLLSLQTWLTAWAYFGLLAGLYSLSLFVSRPAAI